MDSFTKGAELYYEAKFDEAHIFFVKAFHETPNNQLLYPFLATTSLMENIDDKIDFYISYPFNNFLITNARVLENYHEKDIWTYIYEEVWQKSITLSKLSKLILEYFKADDENKISVLENFIPNTNIEEYWKNALYLNTYLLASLVETIFPESPYKEFKEKFKKCIQLYPQGALPYYLRYFIDPIPVIENLDKAIELKSDYFEALKERAWLYFEEAPYDDCIADCDSIIYHNPTQEYLTWALWLKGWALIKDEKFKEAIICFNQSLQIDECQTVLYLLRGSAKNRILNFKDALNDYKKYLELSKNDTDPVILIVLGTLELNLNHYHEAIKYYTEAIAINNNYSIAYLRRATAFQAINQKMLSEFDIKEANEIILNKKDVRFTRADITEEEL